MPTNSQIAQIKALAATGESPAAIAAQVGVEVGDVQSVIGGGLSSGDAGAQGVLTQTKTVTVPHAWILANSMSEASFEVISDTPGERICLLGVVGTLRFGSRPYQGDFETYPYLISSDLISGQQGFSPWAYSLAGGIWEATEDVSFQFRMLAYHVDTPMELGSVSLFLQGSGLTNGDSDLDITLYYMSFKVPG